MNRTKAFLILTLLALTAIGCGNNSGFQADEIPTEIARPEDLEGKPFEDENEDPLVESLPEESDREPEPPTLENDEPEIQVPPVTSPSEPKTPEKDLKPDISKPKPPKSNLWNAVIDMAKWVIQHEAYKVGKACNFFIQRVFENMGFGKSSWVANDFDNYAKKDFSNYKIKSFNQGTAKANQKDLHNYLWSFPEKTAFIFQWERKGRHGHIAFVQRIRNELVIYHASLNQFRPKAQKVTVETLLNKSGRNNILNVFSHFEKSKNQQMKSVRHNQVNTSDQAQISSAQK